MLRNPLLCIYLKHYFFSLKSITKIDYPWITYGAIGWLKKYIRQSHRVFEFGSGSSTIYFAKNAGSVVSVEHDWDYFKYVKSKIMHFENVTFLFKQPQSVNSLDFSYRSQTFPKYHGFSFENYIHTLSKFPDRYFDLILVEGRAREEALKLAAVKCKLNGYVILDNSERELYWRAVQNNGYLLKKHYFGFGPGLKSFWRTSVLIPVSYTHLTLPTIYSV